MNLRHLLSSILFYFYLFSCPLFSQDPISQTGITNQPWLNPAFVGSSGTIRILVSHRIENLNQPGTLMASNISLDMPIRKGNVIHGLGFRIFRDGLHFQGFYRNEILGSYSINLPALNQKARIAAGISAGISGFNNSYARLQNDFFLVYDWRDLFISDPIIERILYYPAFQTGLSFITHSSWIGLNASNIIINPDKGISPFNRSLKLKAFVSGGTKIPINKENTKLFLVPNFAFGLMGDYGIMRVGTEFWFSNFILGVSVYHNPILSGNRGYQLGPFGFEEFRGTGLIGIRNSKFEARLAYDRHTHPSGFSGKFKNSLELSLSLLFGKTKTIFFTPWDQSKAACNCPEMPPKPF